MSNLLDEIKGISIEAAHELRSAGFVTDSDIRTLDRQDLHELLPGKDKLRVRKDIHRLICREPRQSSSYETIIKAKHAPAPKASAAAFLLSRWWPQQQTHESSQERQDSSSPTTDFHSTNEGASHAKPRPLPLTNAHVMYKMVVSGRTLEKHVDVIERLNGPVPGNMVSLKLKEAQREEDSKVTIVFCPIVSRAGTDIAAALQNISSDKPIIVVAMYHRHTAISTPALKTDSRVELAVNVFFHEAVGLLDCSQNHEAINEVKTKLCEYSTKKKSSINPQ